MSNVKWPVLDPQSIFFAEETYAEMISVAPDLAACEPVRVGLVF